MKTNKKKLKVILVIISVVIFAAALLFAVKLYDDSHGVFGSVDDSDESVEYNGEHYTKKDNIETFLVIGLDKSNESSSSDSSESKSVQADFLMLFVFDNNSKQVSAVQINRDTMVNVNRLDICGNVIGTEQKQISLAYNYGYDDSGIINCRNTADSVSGLLRNIKVDHYISVSVDSIADINDLVGGVEVTVLDDFTGVDDSLVKGTGVLLKGEHAAVYVRTRYGLENSTNAQRMERQKQYINAWINKANSMVNADPEFVLDIVERISPYVEYDSTEYRLKEYARKFSEYEFSGIKEIEGKSELGEYIEFYPDEDSVEKLVIDLFYNINQDNQ